MTNPIIGNNIVKLDSVDSTNNYANQMILTKRPENGTLYLSAYQSGGRGQRGNHWESAPNQNLLFSVVLYPRNLNIRDHFQISKAFSLGIIQLLSRHVEDGFIKWPNDIYVGNKKICGVLIENQLTGHDIDTSVIGVGLNINQESFESNAPNPISLRQLTQTCFSLDEMLTTLCKDLSQWVDKIGVDDETINQQYIKHLYQYNEWKNYEDRVGQFVGRITGVDEYGQLMIEKESGEVCTYGFKEVAFK